MAFNAGHSLTATCTGIRLHEVKYKNIYLKFHGAFTVLHLGHVPTMNVSWMFRRDGARDSE